MAQIHATAVVDSRAELGRDVVIGPWCIVEAGAVIGDGCRLAARAIVKSRNDARHETTKSAKARSSAARPSTCTFTIRAAR